jgi:hypothetical protein
MMRIVLLAFEHGGAIRLLSEASHTLDLQLPIMRNFAAVVRPDPRTALRKFFWRFGNFFLHLQHCIINHKNMRL